MKLKIIILILVFIFIFAIYTSAENRLFPNLKVRSETIRFVTAYNVGDEKQCDDTPCISANNKNICEALDRGEKHAAANFVPLGTILYIDKIGYVIVSDRMNRRYKNRVDIAFKKHEKVKALKFGKQKLMVKILEK